MEVRTAACCSVVSRRARRSSLAAILYLPGLYLLGLQIIANNLVGVELAEQKRGDADYSIDGEVPTVSSRRFHGLFLTLKKRESESAIQTLIVPAGEYQPGKRLRMSVAKSSNSIAFGRLLEQQPDWIWATVESLDVAHRDERVTLAPGGL